ncbi:MAG: ankyrin repeat domain-containing protein [Phycisphaeraceae bacterium]|nr:ankyrin repeat domain-containing protein [Phycisphaeraceae bacterium]
MNIGSKGAIVRRLFTMLCLVTMIQTCSFAQDSGEFKSIHAAAAAGSARGILVFNQDGVSVNAKDSLGRTPLMTASESGMSRVIGILLTRNAKIDEVDSLGNTALHHAAANGHVKVISELIEGGANTSIRNGKGRTAKELAVSSGNSRAASEFPSETPYGRVSNRPYEEPVIRSDKLKEVLSDPNEVKARLLLDPKLVAEMAVLFKALEIEETKWTSRTRRIKNTFFTALRKEIDSEIVFIQKVAKQEDANDIVHELDVIQSTWKSVFSQSSRKMRDADRAASAQGMQAMTRPSRSRSRRGQMDAGSSRRPTRTRDSQAVPEVNPHASYIDSWGTVSDTTLDTVYQATHDKFIENIGAVRSAADKLNNARIVNAIDGVMLERMQRGERSLVVYSLTKADLSAATNTNMTDETGRGARSRRGSSQTMPSQRRRR